jgi:hypothetical protein
MHPYGGGMKGRNIGFCSTITRENRKENRYEYSKREEQHMKKAEKKK